MTRSIVPRGILTLTVTVALLAIPVSSAMADRTLDPGTVDFGNRQVNTTSPPQTHELHVFCDAPLIVCALIALAGGADNFTPAVSITGASAGDFAQTNDCLGTLNGATPQGQSCTINTTFTPTSPGPKEATLSTGTDGPMATLTGTGVTTETPPTPPEPGPPTPPTPPPTPPGVTPPTLDLDGKKQELKKKLTFFATANVDATLAVGGSVKDTTKQLAGGERTKVKAKLKSSNRKKLAKKLNKSGKAKAKVEAAASSEGGTALDEIKVKLRD